MAQVARRNTAGHRNATARPLPRPEVGLAVLAGRPASEPAAPPADPAWWHSVRPVARIAVWALPGYAAVHLWWSLTRTPDSAAEPVAWAEAVAAPDYLRAQVLAGLGGSLLGLVALVTLVALLLGLRGRRIAVAALVTGLAAAVVLLPWFGLSLVSARTMAARVRDGATSAAGLYREMEADAAPMVVSGLLLASIAWILLGLAVWRSGAFNRGDGLLLIIAGPLAGAGGLVAPILVPLGALLLLAAGLGIGWTATRLAAGARSSRPGGATAAPGEHAPA